MTPPPACPACGAAHGPAVTCDGAMNYEWHVMPSNRAIVAAQKRRKGNAATHD